MLYIAYKQPVYVIFDFIETYSKSLRCKKYRSSVHAMGNCAVAEMNLQLGRRARVAANNAMLGQKVRDPWVYNNWAKERCDFTLKCDMTDAGKLLLTLVSMLV